MKYSNYKNENVDTKYLNNMGKNQFSKANNNLLELGKYHIELQEREVKLKKVKEELF